MTFKIKILKGKPPFSSCDSRLRSKTSGAFEIRYKHTKGRIATCFRCVWIKSYHKGRFIFSVRGVFCLGGCISVVSAIRVFLFIIIRARVTCKFYTCSIRFIV